MLLSSLECLYSPDSTLPVPTQFQACVLLPAVRPVPSRLMSAAAASDGGGGNDSDDEKEAKEKKAEAEAESKVPSEENVLVERFEDHHIMSIGINRTNKRNCVNSNTAE